MIYSFVFRIYIQTKISDLCDSYGVKNAVLIYPLNTFINITSSHFNIQNEWTVLMYSHNPASHMQFLATNTQIFHMWEKLLKKKCSFVRTRCSFMEWRHGDFSVLNNWRVHKRIIYPYKIWLSPHWEMVNVVIKWISENIMRCDR